MERTLSQHSPETVPGNPVLVLRSLRIHTGHCLQFKGRTGRSDIRDDLSLLRLRFLHSESPGIILENRTMNHSRLVILRVSVPHDNNPGLRIQQLAGVPQASPRSNSGDLDLYNHMPQPDYGHIPVHE